jgi:hypothetical protein
MTSDLHDRDDASRRGALYAGRIWTWRLWGLPGRRLDVTATVVTLALLAISRFALLPSGPWEWDEILFARGVLRFDMPAHFPHPPGFPLWMALGWLLLPVIGDPLRVFQLVSAATSCLVVFPLAALGRRVASAPVAAMAALALLFSPAVWLHAPRGFTDTAAAFFALWAAALAVHGLEGRRATAFTLLITAAFLIRPVLLPPLGLLWLAGAAAVKPRKGVLPGALLGLAAVIVATAGLIAVQGSWNSFAGAFAAHAQKHARNLVEHNPGGFADLGIVVGLGGPLVALGAAAVALAGIAAWWRRRGSRAAIAWLAILVVLIGQLVWLQNRRFSRYAVPLHLALAPLAAATAALAPPALGVGALAAVTLAWAAHTAPLLVEQHAWKLPGWAAVEDGIAAAKRESLDIVIEPGLYPFLSYAEELDRYRGRPWRFEWFLAPASPDADELPTRPYLLVTEYPFHYFPALTGKSVRYGGVSPALLPLTQGRFLKAWVARDVVLPVRGWWLPELPPGTVHKFEWGGAETELLVPPLPAGEALAVDFFPYPGPAPVVVTVNGTTVMTVSGDSGRAWRALDRRAFPDGRTARVVLRRIEAYVPGHGDSRHLGVQLWGFKLVRSAPTSE